MTSLSDKTLFASKPWSVLISMKNHSIDIIDTDNYLSPGQAAVDNLRLGGEFILVDKTKENTNALVIDRTEKYSGRFVTIDIEL